MASLLRSSALAGVARAASMRGLVAPATSVVACRYNSTCSTKSSEESAIATLIKEKLGSTGVVTLTAGVLAFLVSKEYIVFHHETVLVGTFSTVVYGLYRAMGDSVGQSLDARIEQIRQNLNSARVQERTAINEEIAALASIPNIEEFNKLQFDVYRELNTLTNEIARREAEAEFYRDIKFKLDTLVKLRNENRRREQERIVSLVTSQIGGGLTAAQDAALFKDSLQKLQSLSAAAKARK
eukprot:Opistho-2@11406